jgi:hypothetical protein
MADSGTAGQTAFTESLFEIVELADSAPNLDLTIDERSNAGGIVAAVLELA